MVNVDYLYHYTTLETLELILQNKTIRFNSLQCVDDLEEKETSDAGDFGKYCFVSCWTKSPSEDIPLWSMYSKNGKGVRVRLCKNPFKLFSHPVQEIAMTKGGVVVERYRGDYYNSYISEPNLTHDYNVFLNENILDEVIYTQDESLIYPKIFKNTNQASFNQIGIYKSEKWRFQEESRYHFMVLPFNRGKIMEYLANPSLAYDDMFSQRELPIYFIDLHLDEDKINDMEIMLGFNADEEDYEYAKSLVEKYNPTATLIKSELTGKVKLK